MDVAKDVADAGLPPYRQIALRVRRGVADGTLRPGDRVASMREIRAQFGVSIATASSAIRQLRDDGVVVTRPGVGTFIADPADTQARVDTLATRVARLEAALDALGIDRCEP